MSHVPGLAQPYTYIAYHGKLELATASLGCRLTDLVKTYVFSLPEHVICTRKDRIASRRGLAPGAFTLRSLPPATVVCVRCVRRLRRSSSWLTECYTETATLVSICTSPCCSWNCTVPPEGALTPSTNAPEPQQTRSR